MARPGLTGHRKFRRLARALGSPITARGALELLWDSCYEAGDDYVGTAEDIEHSIGWAGDSGMLTRALAEAGAPSGAGFIERIEASGEPVYRVHDLWHHAPDYVAKRRKREIDRQGKLDPRPPNGAERRRLDECQDGDGRPPSPSPSHSPSHKNVSSEAPAPAEPAFLVFPAVGKPDSWPLSTRQVSEWQGLYPNLDVSAECRKGLAWIVANPGRRKTVRGMAKFLVNWLSRATDDRQTGERRPEGRGSSDRRLSSHEPWFCRHEPRCGNRATCAVVAARKVCLKEE